MKDRLLWLACLLYAVLFSALGAIKYAAHRNLVDFGIFAQTMSSGFGCFCNPLEGSHWAFHFSPILYLGTVALAFAHSPIVLPVLQAIACALCAPPVYAMVRTRSGVATARLAALVVLLYPPLAGLAFVDFHENGFAPAAVVWALYAFDAGALRLAGAAAALALCVKEDQAIFLAVAGLLGAWAYRKDARRRTFALAVTGVSALVVVAFFFAIQPHATANGAWQPVRFYSWSPAELSALVPSGLLQRLGFIVLAFAPLAFVPFRTWAFAPAIVPLFSVLASRMSTTFTMGTHYAGAWIGYALFAFAVAVGAIAQRANAKLVLYWCLGLCVVELLIANPLHPGLNLRAVQARDTRLDAFIARVPPGANVATQEEAYTHMALDYPGATLLPETQSVAPDACFMLIDNDFPESPRLQEYGGALTALVNGGPYVLVDRDGGIELYRRVTPCR